LLVDVLISVMQQQKQLALMASGELLLKDFETKLTHARLLELLHYNPATGLWYWLITNSIRKPAGSLAGEIRQSGYVLIGIDGHRYRAHRLAWFYMHGEWPPRQVDHENNQRADNRWHNLRLATNQQNQMNQTISRNNTSGYKGVTWSRQRQKWQAKLNLGDKQIHGGFFADKENAAMAYLALARKHFGSFAREI